MPEVTKVSQMQEKNTVAVLETKLRSIEQDAGGYQDIRARRREIKELEEQANEQIKELKLLGKTIKTKKDELDDLLLNGPKQPDNQQTLPFADDAPAGYIESNVAENIAIPPELQTLDLNGRQKEELVKAGCKTLMDVAALANKEWPKFPNGLSGVQRFNQVTVERILPQLPKREPPELKDGESLVRVRLIAFSDVSPLAEPESVWNAKLLDNGDCIISFGSVEHQFEKAEFEIVDPVLAT